LRLELPAVSCFGDSLAILRVNQNDRRKEVVTIEEDRLNIKNSPPIRKEVSNLKRKIFSVLFAVVLVLSVSLVMAVPAAANPGTLNVRPYTLDGTGTNTAAWSTVQKGTGSYSVLLTYVDGDNAYVEFTPPTGITVNDLSTITSGDWGFWYYASAANGPLLELRFTSGSGHVDITVNDAEASPAINTGTTEGVTTASTCIYFGNDATDQTSFYNNTGSVTLAGVLASIDAQAAMIAGGETAAAWALTRVRAEIGWVGAGRTCYIDDIEIAGVTYYGMIQDAIDTATTGDTISVAAGTYTEDLTVDEELTLQSVAGAATTIIHTAGSPNDIVLITAANVTIDGFTIEGAGVASGACNGIDVRASGFTIQNNVFTDIYHDAIFTGDTATAITAGLIDDNMLTGMGTSAAAYRAAINVESNANAISGVTVSDNTLSAYGGTESAGIQVAEGAGEVSSITVSGNTIGTSSFGIATWNDAAATFTGNTVTGCDVGVDIYGDNATLIPAFTLSGNTINNSTSYGIRVRTDSRHLTGAGTVIKYNTITGNGDGVAVVCGGNVNSAPVASYNWWGSATGPAITATNPGGAGDSVSANVTYEPWLYLTTAANDGDTVANIVTNQVPAYANAVDLAAGWNTFSAPIGLDGQYNTWAELYTLTSLDYSLAYRFDPTTQTFLTLSTINTYAIAPGEGFYVKMNSADSIPYCYSTVFSMPSRALGDGWDMIGGGLTTRTEIASCASIATSGSTAGYSHIISPAENANSWVYIAGASTAGNFVAGEGYWAFLPIDRTLGLFDPTPVAWVP